MSVRLSECLLLSLAFFSASCSVGQIVQDEPVESVLPVVLATYRYLHENPEIGLSETLAHAHIKQELEALGGFQLQFVDKLPTAIIALYDTNRPGPTIALRAELDGRRLESGKSEPIDHNPRSTIDGYMHNCGHDAHAAMLLGAAAYVRRNDSAFSGKFVFVFQPAEETRGGADDIVADGILKRIGVDAIYAQHAVPGEPVGTYSVSKGVTLAGSATFTVTLSGESSHAAAPFQGDDLAVVAARFIEELAYFPARKLDIANRPAVVSVARFSTDATSTNMLPSKVVLEGTIRAFEHIVDNDNPQSLSSLLTARIEQLAGLYGIRVVSEIRGGSPPTRNDARLFDNVIPKLRRQFGSSLNASDYRGMFSEDFSYYTSDIPALYFGTGVMKDGLGTEPVHTPDFTIHTDALAAGTALLVALAKTDPSKE